MTDRKVISWKNMPPRWNLSYLWAWAISIEVWQIPQPWEAVGWAALIMLMGAAMYETLHTEQIDILNRKR